MHRRYVLIRKDDGDDGDDERDDIVIHHHTHHSAGGEHATTRHGDNVLHKILAKADAPPEYWQTEASQPDGHMMLVRQEYNELMVAVKSGNVPAIKQELEDLAAVSIMALRHM